MLLWLLALVVCTAIGAAVAVLLSLVATGAVVP